MPVAVARAVAGPGRRSDSDAAATEGAGGPATPRRPGGGGSETAQRPSRPGPTHRAWGNLTRDSTIGTVTDRHGGGGLELS